MREAFAMHRYVFVSLLKSGVLAAVLALAGCGAGSGAGVTQNPVTPSTGGGPYSGPAPATPDVQSFKLNVWDNLHPTNRCGTCHDSGQEPRFVRGDDVNLAYQAANSVVDLDDPASSTMVAKVRGGHNCWLADANACGDIVEGWIAAWAGNAAGSASEVRLVAPPLADPGAGKAFPESPGEFAATVYPLLTEYCSGCHAESAAVPQAPYFASGNLDTAYAAAKPKMNLDTPAESRFVVRLGMEFHNCWDNCAANAAELRDAIAAFAADVPTEEVDADLVTSKALGLPQGIVASSGGRHESNVIALYEFKTGSGNIAYDTSGVEPAVNLTLSGSYQWVGGWGVAFAAGKAQGSTQASAKIRNLVAATSEFSIEAWVAPANVTQNGPARIVSYSGGADDRNFMLGQTLYSYDALVRSTETDPAGEPRLSTDPDAERLQATLQHVVVTYDPANGRRIYVDGEDTGDADPAAGGLLNDWDDTFALAVGSEVDNRNRWAGTVRLLAIHNRALTPEQISQNHSIGVGEKYYLLFNVSDHVDVPDAYVVFEVSQFDSWSYLFSKPFFVILDPDAEPGDIPMAGLRIGLNSRVPNVGQAFSTLNVEINDFDYGWEGRQALASIGTVIPQERGPEEDQFFLSFERLGDATNVVIEPEPVDPPAPPDVPRDPPVGIRDFAGVDATMSAITGVPRTNPEVAGTFATVHQALPVDRRLAGFISSQQMGITQLAIQYCDALVDDPALRAAFWPEFDWSAPLGTAFVDRTSAIDPLLDRVVGLGLETQPDRTLVAAELDALTDDLTACGGACEPDRVRRVMKGLCAAALGSAAMLVQ
jgi:hypothetical protein